MSELTLKQMLEAGVHFGHQTQRWNPKMEKYIFGERNGIYIINLEITLACLNKALEFLKKVAASGQSILFVGTKKQAQIPLKEAATHCGMPYVNERWLGGMLTNFETIRKSIGRLETIDRMEKDGSFQFVTKKEVGCLRKEREKLVKFLTGIREMKKHPAAIFVVDAKKEEIAVLEARKLGIPVIAVLDTNSDPDLIDLPIPGNDDAIRAIKLFCNAVADCVIAGRLIYEQNASVAVLKEEPEAKPDDVAAVDAVAVDPADTVDDPSADIGEDPLAVLEKAGLAEEDEDKLKVEEENKKAVSFRKPLGKD